MANILVVDDDQDFQEMLRMQLEQARHSVSVASSRAQAERMLTVHTPDLAIVDLMLEELDSGFTLCDHIKRAHPDVPVIIVTAVTRATGLHFDAITDEERTWIKADAMLNKPVRFEMLQAEIKRLLPALA